MNKRVFHEERRLSSVNRLNGKSCWDVYFESAGKFPSVKEGFPWNWNDRRFTFRLQGKQYFVWTRSFFQLLAKFFFERCVAYFLSFQHNSQGPLFLE